MSHPELGLHHRHGIWWDQAPIPRRWHRCRAWTEAILNGRLVARCACGALNDGTGWTDRNSRRKEQA